MNKPWPTVRLGEVLRRSEETIELQPDAEYRQITVKLWGKGVVLRGILTGAEIAASRQMVARRGQFILSRIDARNGALGIVPPELDAAIVTNDFPLFNVVENRLLPTYLGWMCCTASFVEECKQASEGTTNRVRLQEDKFLAREIPLSPLAEQQRVVARIEELAAQIHEARTLRHQAAEEAEALCRAILASDVKATPTPLRELVCLRPPDVVVQASETYQFAGVYCFGRGVFRSQAKTGMDFAYPRLTRLSAGNFVYPKLMAWEGAFGVVPPECDGCVVSTEFPVFEVNEELVFPEVLDTYFRTPAVWPAVAGESTGTNVRRRRLNPQDFLNYKMPLPSRKTQLLLKDVRAQVATLKRLQAETADEIDALLPAILDRAFKGHL
jgi:type I restriction enzyme, S subunit